MQTGEADMVRCPSTGQGKVYICSCSLIVKIIERRAWGICASIRNWQEGSSKSPHTSARLKGKKCMTICVAERTPLTAGNRWGWEQVGLGRQWWTVRYPQVARNTVRCCNREVQVIRSDEGKRMGNLRNGKKGGRDKFSRNVSSST